MDDQTQQPSAGSSDDNGAFRSTGVNIQRPFIVALLFLLNIMLGFSVFVGLVLAYVWRSETDTQEWEKTHYTYLIRTFWIGLVLMVGFMVLWFGSVFGTVLQAETSGQAPPGFFIGIFIGMAVFALTAIWFCIRCILSMVKAGNRQPMPKPETWLF